MISVSVSECPSDVTVSVEILGGRGRGEGAFTKHSGYVSVSGKNSIQPLPICCPVGHSWWPAV